MTITITLDPETEAQLRADAQARGRAPEELAAEAAAAVYGSAPAHRFDPTLIEALREGIADGQAGREVDFADYRAERRAARVARATPPSKQRDAA